MMIEDLMKTIGVMMIEDLMKKVGDLIRNEIKVIIKLAEKDPNGFATNFLSFISIMSSALEISIEASGFDIDIKKKIINKIFDRMIEKLED